MRVCIVGASGKLGKYMVQHCLDRGYEVVGVCRPRSVEKLADFADGISIVPGRTNDPSVIREAVAGCEGVLTVLVPWGVDGYATGTAQAVLDHAEADARLVFSCGWHISRDGRDRYSWKLKYLVPVVAWLARLFRVVDLGDQVEACRRIFDSDRRWTVVRGSDLEEGESQGLPVWSRHVGDPILESNLTRRVDFALFMVEALTNDVLIREAPAIVGCRTPSARAHSGADRPTTRADENEARAILAAHLASYRTLDYGELARRVDTIDTAEIRAPSGTLYQLDFQCLWDSRPDGDIRVVGSIDDGRWRAFAPLTDDFILAPDGTFIGE